MGAAHRQLVLIGAVALLSTVIPQALGGKGKKGHDGTINPQIASICAHARFPEVCTSTTGRHASKYKEIDSRTVLNMQVDAFAKKTAQARKHITRTSRRTPLLFPNLDFCDKMYEHTQDAIKAAQRAIPFKDKATATIMLQLAVQDFESCDRPFINGGIPNPMGKFNTELSQIAQNCIALAQMI
jgi:pectinesterase inhibitor-like protein